MDLFELIKNRRSVRKFNGKTIDKNLINKLIEAAGHAPSACNIQGWKFIIIDQADIKNKIVEMGGSILIKNSPLGILVLYDNRTKNLEYQDHLLSAAMAIQNLQLLAFDLGLGSCCLCHLPTKRKIRKLFGLPNYLSPIAYIILGYPEAAPVPVARKYKLEEISAYNKYPSDWPVANINKFILFSKKILIRIYNLTPVFIKKKFLNKLIDKRYVKKFDN